MRLKAAGYLGISLDDPFGVGPRSRDGNMNTGGDSCIGFANSVGFFTDPEHITTNLAGNEPIALSVRTEYTPNTPLKLAVENEVALFRFGSSAPIAVTASWSVPEGSFDVVYTLVPNETLAEGWYSLLVPLAVREAHGAQYETFAENPLFRGGTFFELENGDLRADFGVGSRPVVAHVSAYQDDVSIKFSETLEAATPPVTVSTGDFELTCRPSGWTGSGDAIALRCIPTVAGDLTVTFQEGFVTAGGAPLRGPDGNTAFSIEVPEDSSVVLGAPEGS